MLLYGFKQDCYQLWNYKSKLAFVRSNLKITLLHISHVLICCLIQNSVIPRSFTPYVYFELSGTHLSGTHLYFSALMETKQKQQKQIPSLCGHYYLLVKIEEDTE